MHCLDYYPKLVVKKNPQSSFYKAGRSMALVANDLPTAKAQSTPPQSPYPQMPMPSQASTYQLPPPRSTTIYIPSISPIPIFTPSRYACAHGVPMCFPMLGTYTHVVSPNAIAISTATYSANSTTTPTPTGTTTTITTIPATSTSTTTT